MMSIDHSSTKKELITGSPNGGEPVFIAIGKLQRTHGVKGEIIMEILTDFPHRIKSGRVLNIGNHHKEYKVNSVRTHGNKLLISFDGLTDCDKVSILRNQMVYIKTTEAEALPENEYYHHEIIGMTVFDESERLIGTVTEILLTGANDVYVITSENNPEILIPAIKSVIIKIEREKKQIIVRLPEWE